MLKQQRHLLSFSGSVRYLGTSILRNSLDLSSHTNMADLPLDVIHLICEHACSILTSPDVFILG